MTTPIALTIAGSDPSGGAGLQADLKTFHQHRVYGASVVTLVTVQSSRGVSDVEVLRPGLVRAQLDAVLGDLAPAAAKTGALGNAGVVETIADGLASTTFPLVVDPVMLSKHGASLLEDAARRVLVERLFPRATLVTPNAPEAGLLLGREVRMVSQARDAARALHDLGAEAVLVKGGHLEGDAVDVLFADGVLEELRAARIETRAGHGTGCTYAAAITAWLARGVPLAEAVRRAKAWLTAALRNAPGIGHGVGPVRHLEPVPGLEDG